MANFLKSSMCVHRYQQYLSPSQKLGYLDHPVLRKVWNKHFSTFFFFLDFSIQNAKNARIGTNFDASLLDNRCSFPSKVAEAPWSKVQNISKRKKFQILTLDPPVPLRNFWYYNRVKITLRSITLPGDLVVLRTSNFEVLYTSKRLDSVMDLTGAISNLTGAIPDLTGAIPDLTGSSEAK